MNLHSASLQNQNANCYIFMIKPEDVYPIGTIQKTHGLKGEVVFNFTDDIFDTTDAEYLLIEVDGIFVPFFIKDYRFRSDFSALIQFDDIDSADQAKQIVGCTVFFEKSKVQEAGEEEVSLNYFIGFGMQDADSHLIGTVSGIDDNTENWLFIVERPDGKEVLVPAHEELIIDIDHDKKMLTMQLPDGLLAL